MKKYIVLLLLFLASARGISQDTTGILVVLSDKTGPTIDLEERNFYRMFLSVQNFESAVLLQRPDSSYIFKVIIKKEDEPSVTIRWFSKTAEEIELIRHYIETYKGIQYKALQHSSGPTTNISGVRISGEFLVGGVCGIGFSFVFALLGAETIGPHGGEDPGIYGAFIGLFIGSTFGSSLGVYLIGESGDETGSYWASLLGSTLGMGIFLAILPDPDDTPFWVGLYALPTLGGIIGFNLTRRYEASPASGSAIINFKYSQMNLAFPTIYFRPSPLNGRTLIQNIDLVQVHF